MGRFPFNFLISCHAVMSALGGFVIICIVREPCCGLMWHVPPRLRSSPFSGRPVAKSPLPLRWKRKKKHTQTDTNRHKHAHTDFIHAAPLPFLSQLQLLIFSVQAAACLCVCVKEGRQTNCVFVCMCIRVCKHCCVWRQRNRCEVQSLRFPFKFSFPLWLWSVVGVGREQD